MHWYIFNFAPFIPAGLLKILPQLKKKKKGNNFESFAKMSFCILLKSYLKLVGISISAYCSNICQCICATPVGLKRMQEQSAAQTPVNKSWYCMQQGRWNVCFMQGS